MVERKPRIFEGCCAECSLRILLRGRGAGFDESPAETDTRCLRGPDPFQCQSYREALTKLRKSARRET
jgi:hypothetical protein